MLLYWDRHRRWQPIYKWLMVGVTVVGTSVTSVLKVDSKEVQLSLARTAVTYMQTVGWWTAPACIALLAILQSLTKPSGSEAFRGWARDIINELRDDVFEEEDKKAPALHRLTLFQYRKWSWALGLSIRYWRWPGSGWLIPVERSGDVTRRTNSAFPAGDDNRTAGVVGQAWAQKVCIYVPNLPSIDPKCDEAAIKLYAQETFVSAKWVRKQKRRTRPPSRSYCGVPVEVDGRRWGVLLFDSCHPEMIEKAKIVRKCIGKSKELAKMLKNV